MNVVHTLCVVKIICMASAVPVGHSEQSPRLRVLGNEDDPREKRSHFGSVYVSPCAAAASSSVVETIAPPPVKLAPKRQYMRPYSYDNYHRYRSIDPNENELLSFTDMNHIATENMPVGMEGIAPYYPGEARIPALNAQYPAAQTMPAYGVFPYTNPSALNVPLLFTCSPSIVQGQVVQPQPQYYSGYSTPDIYRDIELQSLDPQDQVQTHPEHLASPQKPSKSDKKSE